MTVEREKALDKVDKLSLFTYNGFELAMEWIDNNIVEIFDPELYNDLVELAKINALKHGRIIE